MQYAMCGKCAEATHAVNFYFSLARNRVQKYLDIKIPAMRDEFWHQGSINTRLAVYLSSISQSG
jgi:polyferredoxin